MKSTRVFYAAVLCLLSTFESLNAAERFHLFVRTLPAQNRELPDYFRFRFDLSEQKQPVSRQKGLKDAQRFAVKRSSAFLKKKMGKNYFTQSIAPILLKNFYKTFVPQRSNQIKWKGWMRIVDGSVNQLVNSEKKHLVKMTQKFLPDVPIVGNLVSDLVDSQKLRMKKGVLQYEMDLKKRVAPEIKMGKFSFAGGAETRPLSKSTTLVAAFKFKDTKSGEQYSISILGEAMNFKMKTKHVDASVDWKPNRGVQFNVHLTF